MRQMTLHLLNSKIDGPPMVIDGAYAFKHPKIQDYYFQVIASTGMGWEHVSVTLRQHNKKQFVQRCPTWSEMCYIKNLFWDENEAVMQIHPPRSNYVNNHPFCLHLWKPLDSEIPTPDTLMV